MANPVDGKFVGVAEMVIIASEPTYQPDGGNSIVRIREMECFRFCASLRGLQSLVKTLNETIAEVEQIEEALKGVTYNGT